MKDDEDEDILIENLGVHPSRPAQRVISGTIECLLDSITQVNSQIVQSVLPLPLHCTVPAQVPMLLVPVCASTNASTTLVPLISNLLLQVQALVQELALILVASSAIASASASELPLLLIHSHSQPHLIFYIPTFIVTAEKSNIAQRHTLQCTTDNVHWTMQLGKITHHPRTSSHCPL